MSPLFRTRPIAIAVAASFAGALLLLAAPASAPAKLFGWRPGPVPARLRGEPCPTAAVLDFQVAERMAERRDPCTREKKYFTKPVATEVDSRRWGLAKQDIYLNGNVGRQGADLFSTALSQSGVYRTIARADIERFYLDKREVIRNQLRLSDTELQVAVTKLDPIKVGRELGVDKVVVGFVLDSEVRHEGIGRFKSLLNLRICIYDVASGQLEFDRVITDFRKRSTQYFHYQEAADELVRQLQYANGAQGIPNYMDRRR